MTFNIDHSVDILQCKFVAADSTVCPADPPRRFDYIQYKKGPTYGDSKHYKKSVYESDVREIETLIL